MDNEELSQYSKNILKYYNKVSEKDFLVFFTLMTAKLFHWLIAYTKHLQHHVWTFLLTHKLKELFFTSLPR